VVVCGRSKKKASFRDTLELAIACQLDEDFRLQLGQPSTADDSRTSLAFNAEKLAPSEQRFHALWKTSFSRFCVLFRGYRWQIEGEVQKADVRFYRENC